MNYEQHRRHLELSIIGSCILENKYNEVSFLTAKNFHVWGEFDLPFVWECLPGNIFQVSDNGRKKGRDIMGMVCDLTTYSVFSHIQPLALMLMQDEYRDGFITTLQKALNNSNNATEQSAITEVMMSAGDYNNDVFQEIDSGIDYVKMLANERNAKLLIEYQERVKNKCLEIKKITNGRV